MQKRALNLLYIVITSTQYSMYTCVCACSCVWGEKEKKLHTHKSRSRSTPIYLNPPHLKSAYYFILHQDHLFFVNIFIKFLQCKLIFCIDPHYTLDLSNYFNLKLL